VHDRAYLEAFQGGALDAAATRRIGLGAATSGRLLIERTHAEVAGTLLTARLALEGGLAVNTAGGTHHAHPGFGSGYCILNDLAVTAEALLAESAAAAAGGSGGGVPPGAPSVSRVLILDLDVHQARAHA
jgi:acetoin utilization deacetylase AcuC-like enzyme